MDEIELGDGKNAPEFLILSTAKVINEADGKNWVSVIVKVGEEQYPVID
ncbi:MAG: hypothetical protein F6K40_17080 [Okeania sp. SIO3I5]|nr:hypothetical protein [Okeania sp. SIO3I5]NEQ37880.1 hypothetical protein [Okeania sp. SIO3I5]